MIRTTYTCVLILIAGCSLQNREGPLVTCADLGDGATNACEQGIIATCSGGIVSYRVCDDENVCGLEWQTAGRYRCDSGESLPEEAVAGAAGGNHTSGAGGASGAGGITSGSGGAGGPSGSGSGGGAGSAGAGGQITDGGTRSCGPADICTIATTDSGYGIQALALDDDNVFFIDGCGTIKSVPKVGGFSSDIEGPEASSGCLNLPASLALTSTHLFATSPSDNVLRVINMSDSSRVESYPTVSSGLAADADAAYWGRSEDLHRYTSSTGMLETFGAGSFTGTNLTAGGGDLFWLSQGGSTLHRIAKNAGQSDTPTSVSLSPSSATEIAVDGSVVYFVSRNDGQLGRVDASGAVSTILDGLATPDAVAVNATHVFWTDSDGLHAVPKGGGQVEELEVGPGVVPGLVPYGASAIIADNEFVFVADGSEIRRVPR